MATMEERKKAFKAKGDATREQMRFKNFRKKDDAQQLKRKRKAVKDSLAKETKKAGEKTQIARGFKKATPKSQDAKPNQSDTPRPNFKKTEVKKNTSSFGKAFADARRAGKKTFMYNGKSYTTKRADDKPKASIKSQDAKPNQSNAPKPNFKSFDKATKAEKKVLQKRFPEKKSEVKKSEVKKSKPRSTLQKLFGASKEKRKLGRNMQKRAQASMGMKKGGKVGGCKVDGIAIRGRTRARHK